jgi:thiamine-phosphate pyrophosphorylase
VLRYYITDRSAFGGSTDALLACIATNIATGVDYVQIREKDLSALALLDLTRRAVALAQGRKTRILVNDRADIAVAAGAHGVHLRAGSITPVDLRPTLRPDFLIAVSCHTRDDIRAAAGADFIVYGPVFASPGKGPAIGLEALAEAARIATMPVLALGGIDVHNADACVRAGAAGIAAIRMFQDSCA